MSAPWPRTIRRSGTGAALLLAALFLGACGTLGPPSISRDRLGYSAALSTSWKEQTLLNIVRLRYMDTPVFVDVSSIVAGYTLETTVDAGASFFEGSTTPNSRSLGAQGTFTDRPTITYIPMTGEKFMRAMLEPIAPRTVLSLLQSGYPAGFMLGLTTGSVNGLRNWTADATGTRDPDPEFVRLLSLLQVIQRGGRLGLRVEAGADGKTSDLVLMRRDGATPEVAAAIDEAGALLGLDPGRDRFRLIYGSTRGAPDEFTMGTRSIMQILATLASFVEVPAEDLADGRASPGQANGDAEQWPIRVKSGKERPADRDAFVAVQHRSNWFWIDDTDLRSKRAFGVIIFVFTLADTGGEGKAPVLTISAQ
jgi:hypothetical protein